MLYLVGWALLASALHEELDSKTLRSGASVAGRLPKFKILNGRIEETDGNRKMVVKFDPKDKVALDVKNGQAHLRIGDLDVLLSGGVQGTLPAGVGRPSAGAGKDATADEDAAAQGEPGPDEHERKADIRAEEQGEEENVRAVPQTCTSPRFFTYSFAKFESMFPELRQCSITTYGGIFYKQIQKHPCRVAELGDADYVIMPPYMATECNWPHYGGGLCDHPENSFRAGTTCREPAAYAAQKLASSTERKVLILDADYEDDCLDSRNDDRLIWAKQNANEAHFRRGKDISMPPPPTVHCQSPDLSAAFAQPLEHKSYFATFLGSIYGRPEKTEVRTEMEQAPLHDGGSGVLVVGTDSIPWGERYVALNKGNKASFAEASLIEEPRYDYDDLLHHSTYGLIPRGDGWTSYRFTEVVCSGGVPVLVGVDGFVPPFDGVMPFSKYGVWIAGSEVEDLGSRLHAIPVETAEGLRSHAKTMCETHLQTPAAQFETLLQSISKLPIDFPRERESMG